ncbi:DUF3991 and TOPRIM domain-containing protein [Rhodopirellula bahusiensis]|uniref:Toprim domain-containing protein n=1 Tax=Rhodopirellula bahusiensis TaxID=2014065 RepID=A0A2G1W2D3_9BACT|nr:DUF3991 and TOPRIM domain-containing protein [Rhodopirellula bahusiensis]PHQ33131.1 hypothetical protein CEE69_21970 [Rhodopirellula bahusiensis]
MIDRKAELDQFKRINLAEYASSRGFVMDRRASSRHSMVMRHPRGDKLIISRDASGLYYYFNAKGSDSGTIIDLVGSLDGSNLGEIRKTLRAYGGSQLANAPTPTLPFVVEPATHDAAGVLKAWMEMKDATAGHSYLTEHRGISAEVQTHPIFSGRIRIDRRGNAAFPHFGPGNTGLCGFELKNGNANGTTFTGFSPGGLKALHCSRPRDTDREAVICETAIDMLSLATLEGTERRRFFSTAGQISPLQAECLRSAANRMPRGSRVVIATDNDDGGIALASKIEEALRPVDIPIVRHMPPTSGDWNDVLLQKRDCSGTEIRFG